MLAKPRTLWIGILDVTVPFLGSGCLVLWTNGRKAKWLQDKSMNPGTVWFVQPQWSNLPWTSWGCHSPNCHLISVVTVGTRFCVGHFDDVIFCKGMPGEAPAPHREGVGATAPQAANCFHRGNKCLVCSGRGNGGGKPEPTCPLLGS